MSVSDSDDAASGCPVVADGALIGKWCASYSPGEYGVGGTAGM